MASSSRANVRSLLYAELDRELETLGTATDGILVSEAHVESIEDDGPTKNLVLRLLSPATRQQRRQDVRLPLDVPARRTLRLEQGNQIVPLRSRVLDISAGGALLNADARLSIGDRVVVAFTLPGDGQELRVCVVVRHIRPAGPSRWEVGCRFQVLRPADRERIARYIFGQQREAARRRRSLEV